MFVAPGILSLIASVAASGLFPSNLNGDNGPLGCCRDDRHCETIPMPDCIREFNAHMDGEHSKRYRDQLKSLSFRKRKLFSKSGCYCVEFGVTTLTITCEEFQQAIYDTILARDNIKVSDLCDEARNKMNEVIIYIFEAVDKHGGNDFDLFIFTAIAMFNHNSFTHFPDSNTNNSEGVCRGLLQIKSEKYYKMLKRIGHHDYVNKRYLLDDFKAVTIEDEYQLYKCEFAAKGDRSAVSMMRHTIKKMASFEGQALEDEGCRDICKIANKELRLKLQNRFSILDHLLLYIADNDQIITITYTNDY